MKFLQRILLEPAYQGIQPTSRKPSRIHQDALLCSSLFRHYKRHTLELGRELRARLKCLYHLIRTALSHTVSAAMIRRSSASPAHAGSRTDENFQEIPGSMNVRWIRTSGPYPDHAGPTINHLKNGHDYLAGRLILCIGGRAALYPDYRRLIETAGGQLMVFRGGTRGKTECLFTLLACADSVICPVDCIDHEDFFSVRRYCQYTRKHCVMLERSDLVTFGKTVAALAWSNCHNLSRSACDLITADNTHHQQIFQS